MFKFILACLVTIVFSSCGVSTSSSPAETSDAETQEPSTIESISLVDPNPVDSSVSNTDLIDPNPVVPDDGNETVDSDDGNETVDSDDGNETVDSDDGNETVDSDPINPDIRSEFDTSGAVEDSQACIATNGYGAISDTSLDAEGYKDLNNAIKITSYYPFNAEPDYSEVKLYHVDLEASTVTNVYTKIDSDKYQVSFDQSWLANSNRIIYVRTPKSESYKKFGCYRYDLNSIESGSIEEVKVYRVF